MLIYGSTIYMLFSQWLNYSLFRIIRNPQRCTCIPRIHWSERIETSLLHCIVPYLINFWFLGYIWMKSWRHSFLFSLLDLPEISLSAKEVKINENGSLTVECRAVGKPQPKVGCYMAINGAIFIKRRNEPNFPWNPPRGFKCRLSGTGWMEHGASYLEKSSPWLRITSGIENRKSSRGRHRHCRVYGGEHRWKGFPWSHSRR